MKIYIYIITFAYLFLINSLQLKSQVNYIYYFNKSNYAEYLVFKHKYKPALRIYKKLFNSNYEPKYKDLVYAIVSAIHLGKYNLAESFIKKIPKKNIKSAYIILSSDSMICKQFLSKNIKKYKKLFYVDTLSINISIKKEEKLYETFKPFMDSDQLFVSKRPFLIHCSTDSCVSLKLKDSLFYNRYIDFIELYGYPGGYVSGTDNFSLLNLHIFSGNQFLRFKDIMIKQLEKGVLYPRELYYAIDRLNYKDSTCGLNCIYTSNYCNLKNDWKIIVEESLKYGKSIFLESNPRIPFKSMKESELIKFIDIKYLKKKYGYNIFN